MIKILFLDIENLNLSKKDKYILKSLRDFGLGLVYLWKGNESEISHISDFSLSILNNGGLIREDGTKKILSYENMGRNPFKGMDQGEKYFFNGGINQIRVRKNLNLDHLKGDLTILEDENFSYILNGNRSRLKAIEEILTFFHIKDDEALFFLKDIIDKDLLGGFKNTLALRSANPYIREKSSYKSDFLKNEIYSNLNRILF